MRVILAATLGILVTAFGFRAEATTAPAVTEYNIPLSIEQQESPPGFQSNATPSGIAVGPDGAMWFGNGFVNTVGRITTDINPTVRQFQVDPLGLYPGTVTAGPDNAVWFVMFENGIGRIATDGSYSLTVPSSGLSSGINGPAGIVTGPDSDLWFTDDVSNDIGRITTGASPVITRYPLANPDSQPGDITVGPDGALWFVELEASRIGRITTGPSPTITEYPISTTATGIVAGPDGALWFTAGTTINRITTDASPVVSSFPLPSIGASASGIALGPDGALWFTESNNKIGRLVIGSSPIITEYPVPTASSNPNSIAAGPDGAMWFTEYNAHQIGRITLPMNTLAVSVSGNGQGQVTSSSLGTASLPGLACNGGTTGCSFNFPSNNLVTLTATAAPGSTFTGWSGGGCSGTGQCVITLGADMAVTAAFAQIPTTAVLSVTDTGSGSGTVSSSPSGINCTSGSTGCSFAFPAGNTVTLTATPSAGSMFQGWSGGGCSGTGTCVVTLGADTAVTASFSPAPTATLSVAPNAGGTITSSPAGINCGQVCSGSFPVGTVVTLSFTPSAGYVFNGWSGGGCSGTGTCIVTLNAATSVSASTGPIPSVLLTVSIMGLPAGTVTSNPAGIYCRSICSYAYTQGTTVTLTATPPAGYVFTGWEGGGCSTTGPCTLTLTSNSPFSPEVYATFGQVKTDGPLTEYPVTANLLPVAVTTGPDGALWFTDFFDSIGRLTADGSSASYFEIGGAASFEDASSIVTGSDGALWFTAGGSAGSEIGRITTNGSITYFPLPTSNASPRIVTVGPDGALWFTEPGLDGGSNVMPAIAKIGRITTAGAITEYALPQPASNPYGIATGPDGALWFTEEGCLSCSPVVPGKIGRITTSGVITEYPVPTGVAPLNITEGADGALWFTQGPSTGASANQLGRIDTSGNVVQHPINFTADGITTGPDGALWFTDYESPSFVGRLTLGGVETDYPTATTQGESDSITTGPDGAMWFAEIEANSISRIPIPTNSLTASLTGTGQGQVTSSSLGVASLPGINCSGGSSGCAFNFPSSNLVTLTATAASGSTFTGWAGGGCSGTAPCVITLGADTAVTANFDQSPAMVMLSVVTAGNGAGMVVSSPFGVSCGIACNGSFAVNQVVMLSATPAFGSTFAGWSGGGCSGTGACVVTLASATTVTATFTAPVTVALSVSESGGGTGTVASSPSGISCGSTCGASFDYGTAVTLTATPSPSSVFNGWSGACTGIGPCEVTMNANTAVTASFIPAETLSIGYGGGGAGIVLSNIGGTVCAAACNLSYGQNTLVILTATAAPGSVFVGWSGGGCSGTNLCEVTLSNAENVTADFAPIVTLSVAGAGNGAGTISGSSVGIDCGATCSASIAAGTAVALTAAPSSGSTFAGWSGGGCSGTAGCLVTPTSSTTVTASFAQIPIVTLSVATAGTGSGTVTSNPSGIACGSTCSTSVTEGSQVTLTASASTGSTFQGWAGGGCSGTGNCVINPSASTSVTANFALIPTTAMLSITRTGNGTGTLSSSPSGIACGSTCNASFDLNMPITLTATPSSGSTFTGWSGGGCRGVAACTVTLAEATAMSASFVADTKSDITLFSSLLPTSRSVEVGSTATFFGTVINSSADTAGTNCTVAPAQGIQASFSFQTTDSATNASTGTANTPVNIPAGGVQSFVLSMTPNSPISPTDVAFSFTCTNSTPAASDMGLNTLQFSASTTPTPDVVALVATLTGDGIVDIPGNAGTGAFAVATVNVGASGAITASANDGTANLPVTITICETVPSIGQCMNTPSPSVQTTINANATPTFAIFVQGNGAVPFSPAANRIFVQFTDSGGNVRGSTSVAVRTQ